MNGMERSGTDRSGDLGLIWVGMGGKNDRDGLRRTRTNWFRTVCEQDLPRDGNVNPFPRDCHRRIQTDRQTEKKNPITISITLDPDDDRATPAEGSGPWRKPGFL
jgi:hypothetical protein